MLKSRVPALALTVIAPLCMALSPVAWAQSQPEPAPTSAATDDTDAPDQPDRIGRGDTTRHWLGHQAARVQASRQRQTLSGNVMTEVNKRYVRSFSVDVPATTSLRPETNLR